MNTYCKDKVAVVTGAGGTLCSAIAIDLAKKGAKVVLVGRTREKLEKVENEIAASGGICRIEPADVTDEAAMRDMADRVAAEWGPCRFLINGAGGGAILNFASMNTYRPLTRVAPYAMSKAAIANWTMFFAQYMAPAKVRVNAVAPGFMVNERSKQYLMTPDGGLSPRGEQVMHHTPAGRFGEAEDLLGCVNWLLDDSVSSFVTGITVPVDGGFLSSAGV